MIACGGNSEREEPGPSEFVDGCRETCELEAECLGTDAASCSQGCSLIDDSYPSECKGLFIAVGRCERSVGCEGVRDFAETGRDHAECGAAYDAWVTRCGVGGGRPPSECVAFCANAEACAPDRVYGICADGCSLALGTLEATFGSDCADAYLEIYACEATLTCDELEAALAGVAPERCVQAAAPAAAACG